MRRFPPTGSPDGAGFRRFTVIWLGQVVSLVGSGLSAFALGVWVYHRTGSVTQFSLIAVTATAPMVLLLPVAGALVDRWDRRRVMMAADTVSAAATLAVAGLLAAGDLRIWHIYAATAVIAAATAFQWPAFTALTTVLVPKHKIGRSAGMTQFARAASQVLSPLLAGQLVATVRIQGILFLDCLTFLVSFLILWWVRTPEPVPEGEPNPRSLHREVREGWRYIAERPGLLRLMLLFLAMNLYCSFAIVLAVPLVLSFASTSEMGVTIAVGTAGLLVGGAVVSVWNGPHRRVRVIVGASLAQGVGMIVVGVKPWPWLVAAGLFLFHFWIPVINGNSQALWQLKVPIRLQGRVFALRRMAATSTTPLGYLLAGPLADTVFEPLMRPGGSLSGGPFGTGPGRGIGLLYAVLGLTCLAVNLWALSSPPIMRVEREIPDADQVPEPRPVG